MSKVKLYHGSRGGISGDIRPYSRETCDFGRGFYMGTNPYQAKGMVAEADDPVFYELSLDMDAIPESRILRLEGDDWLNTVIACRDRIKEFSTLDIAKTAKKNLEKYDLVIGPIADDRMTQALKMFQDGLITDAVLKACLDSIDYGYQYVARTDFACSKIAIEKERDIYGSELASATQYTHKKRRESQNIILEMTKRFRGQGKYLDEIISEQKELTKSRRGDDDLCR